MTDDAPLASWVETDDADDPCALCVRWAYPPEVPDDDRWDGGLQMPYDPYGQRVTRLYRRHHDECEASMVAHTTEQEGATPASDELVAVDPETLTALIETIEETLDLLEELVRAQWVHTGEGWYRQPDNSTGEAIADVLATHRPRRWARTTTGLHWHPELEVEEPT